MIVLIWSVLVLSVFLVNSLVYKFSFFSLYHSLNTGLIIACLVAVSAFAVYLSRGWILLPVAVWWLPLGSFTESVTEQQVASPDKPNIFIIGVDSLRADIVEAENSPTPVLKTITESSVYFQNALTPIARTFPSWVAILTGNAPQTTGVRINLQDVSQMDWSHTLPSLLQQQGYQTALCHR